MSVLSDRDLADLYPEYRGDVGPASIDLHIGSVLWLWPDKVVRDPRVDQSSTWRRVPIFGTEASDQTWLLKPNIRYLATTQERLHIPDDCAGQISARSSWGRDGLNVICGPAGWCDPGYIGNPTLELSVIGSMLLLWPGASIAQLIIHRLETPCLHPYRGKYQLDAEPTPSRLHTEVTP
jgi:deoxycytidine triphosphate deaminase